MAYEKYIDEVIYKNRKEAYQETLQNQDFGNSTYRHYDQIQIIYKFPNGYGASLIHGLASYDLELAVLHNGELTYETSVTNDVVGYIEDQGELDLLLKSIYELN